MNKYNLEYCDKQGCFHYSDIRKKHIKNNYKTVAFDLDLEICNIFTDSMFKKYKNINSGINKKIPSYQIILKEYYLFSLRN